MTTTQTPEQYALTLLGNGETPRKAADQSGLEVGQVVRLLHEAYLEVRNGGEVDVDKTLETLTIHPSRKVQRAATRLLDTLKEERPKVELLKRQRQAEKELAAVKAQLAALRGKRAPRPGEEEEKVQCAECGRWFKKSGLSLHMTRLHS